jgi:hypothetical protein
MGLVVFTASLAIILVALSGAIAYQRSIHSVYPQRRAANAIGVLWTAVVVWAAYGYRPIGCLGVGILMSIFGDALFRAWTIRILGPEEFRERMLELLRRAGRPAYIRHVLGRQLVQAMVPVLLLILVWDRPNQNVRMLAFGLLGGLVASFAGTVRFALQAERTEARRSGEVGGAA